ncbi:hypothetical protein [Nocardia asteroides]|uniref:hypothetical protein n=1 Tax=Nocardia asteroides TaxID=1824 RepID=UPI0033C10124
MSLTYATPDQLAEYCTPAQLDELGDDDVQYLAEASRLVRAATRNDLYDTTPTGAPTDPDLIGAFAEATCLQVRAWIVLGLDPRAGVAGMDSPVASASVNGAAIAYTGAAQDEAAAESLTCLVPAAMDVLRDLGLCSAAVVRR